MWIPLFRLLPAFLLLGTGGQENTYPCFEKYIGFRIHEIRPNAFRFAFDDGNLLMRVEDDEIFLEASFLYMHSTGTLDTLTLKDSLMGPMLCMIENDYTYVISRRESGLIVMGRNDLMEVYLHNPQIVTEANKLWLEEFAELIAPSYYRVKDPDQPLFQ